ncbi:MAG: radical SAM protein [Candidatus Omnitrophica bacterium]|nr:radical SAM protein [Candidatus Omnitrophota bacterium]
MKYISPPMLRGYNYSLAEARKAGSAKRLLATRIETSAVCNLRCRYCNGVTGKKLANEISLGALKEVISQVKDLGARSIVVIGGGEPTLYPYFRSLIRYIDKNGLIPVVITNATRLNLALAQFLNDHNASVLVKMDSLDEAKQDYLVQQKGVGRKIRQGLANLFSVGFNKTQGGQLRCGASFVLTAKNYKDILDVWKYCRDNNLYPNLEELILRNHALSAKNSLWLEKDKVMAVKESLLKLDREKYGYDWLVHSPMPGHGCLQHFYSLYITCQGYVQPCADVMIRDFNIKDMRISEILDTPFFKLVRDIGKHLQGKCSGCPNGDLCVGCRGLAFSVGVEEGKDIYQAICREDPLCCR